MTFSTSVNFLIFSIIFLRDRNYSEMPRRNLFLNRKYLAIQKKNQRRRIRLNDLSVEVVTNRVTGEPVADELLLNESVLNEPSTHDLLLDEPLLDEPLLDEPLLDEPTSTDDSETNCLNYRYGTW